MTRMALHKQGLSACHVLASRWRSVCAPLSTCMPCQALACLAQGYMQLDCVRQQVRPAAVHLNPTLPETSNQYRCRPAGHRWMAAILSGCFRKGEE